MASVTPTTNGNGTFGQSTHSDSTSQPQMPPQSSSASGSPDSVSKDEVGWYFVQSYYTLLNTSPERLYQFYSKRSTQVWGTEGVSESLNQGTNEISDKLKSMQFRDCKVRISNVDSQASMQGGIIVMVLGEMSNNNEPAHKFTQSFFLAPQANGYFVLNDMFRYLKDEEEVEEEMEIDEPAVEAAVITEEIVDDTVIVHATEVTVEDVSETVGELTIKETAVTVDDEDVTVEENSVTIPIPTDEGEQGTDAAVASALNGVNGLDDIASSVDGKSATDEAPIVPPIVVPSPAKQAEEANVYTPSGRSESIPTPPPSQGATTPVTPATAAPPAALKPAAPAIPKTWAERLKIGTAALTPATSPAASVKESPVPKATPEIKTTPAAPVSAAPASPGGWQMAGSDNSRRHTRPGSISSSPQTGVVNAYIKHVGDKVDEDALRNALLKHGKLRNFEVSRQRNCAFAEFETAEGFAAAKAASPYRFDGHEVILEERRPRPAFNGPMRGGSQSGRGDLRGSLRGSGSFRGGAGDRFDNRGGFESRGGRGGRGGFTPRGRGNTAQS